VLEEAWTGWFGATLIPAVGVGLLNVLVMLDAVLARKDADVTAAAAERDRRSGQSLPLRPAGAEEALGKL
jgi:hypothetical protein